MSDELLERLRPVSNATVLWLLLNRGWPGDVILGDDDGVVVLPSQHAAQAVDEAIRHDEMEQAILEHTQREKTSPKRFYPFNEETERLYRQSKEKQA